MNLEDRLRSHLHSGEDLFVEGQRDSAAISAAGHRRTRRNQMAVGGVACFAVLGLVFGASSLQGSGTDRLATEALPGSDTAMSGEAATEVFDGPVSVSFDVIVGIDDGFAGLRNTDGVITAIRSDDGVVWDERPTDLPDGIGGVSLAHGDGVFAVNLSTAADPASGQSSSSIATSPDLESWNLVEVVPSSDVELSFNSLSVNEGMVVAPVTLFPRQGGDEEESASQFVEQSAVLTGPIGGPYELTETTDLFSFSLGITTFDAGFASWVSDQDGFSIITSSDSGTSWQQAALPDPELALTGISTVDGDLFVLGTGVLYEGYRSPDNGLTWIQLDVPSNLAEIGWQGTTVHTNGQTAVVRLSGPGDNGTSLTAIMVNWGDQFVEVDLTAHMTAEQIDNSMLVATSDEEALFQFFGTPSNDPSLASSSGVAPDGANSQGSTSAPGYISVPLS